MADLRTLVEGLGCGAVRTLLNSGNVVFTHPTVGAEAHAKAIANAVRTRFGFDVPVVVKSASELATIARQNELAEPGVDPSRLLVIFAQSTRPPAVLSRFVPTVRPPDRILIGERAAYLHCPNGLLASPPATTLLGGLGTTITTRNWATVLKLLDLTGPASAADG
jgi:uncharacterized protein (DUF1697 family)